MTEPTETYVEVQRKLDALTRACAKSEQDDGVQRYLAARDAVVEAQKKGLGKRIRRALSAFWHKCWGGLVLLWVTGFFALGLCL